MKIRKMCSIVLAPVAMITVLAGCQTTPVEPPANSPLGLANSARVRLNVPLTVPSGKSRAYVQDGRERPRKQVAEQRPYCYFLANRPSGQQREDLAIEPDTFQVGEVNRRMFSVGLEPSLAVYFAIGAGEGGNMRTWATVFEISSSLQPAVNELVCAIWTDNSLDRINLPDIRDVLGEVATLEAA